MIDVRGDLFLEIGMIVIVAAFAAYILRLLKQPQLLGYVLVGILITPIFQIVTDTKIIESMSLIGIAFLLFIVGLEMDLKSLRNVALVSTLGGMIQVIILFVFGYFLALLMGFLTLEASYLGLLLSFSSTMVVVKLLSDKRELNTLHGRLVVGFLMMQDIVAIFALTLMTTINDFNLLILGMALVKFLALFLLSFLASKFLFPRLIGYAAKNQELLLITSLAVCFIFSLAFSYLGFSVAIGAFVAGVALGSLSYNLEIIGKVKSLKDFFSLLFFVSLGMGISLGVIKEIWPKILILVLVVIILKPFIIMLVCSLFKYTKRPAFTTAISLAQVGEFSLILCTQGLLLGHISPNFFSLIVIVTLVSITLTSYFIKYDDFFYRILSRPLKIFDYFTTEGMEYLPSKVETKIVLCGYNRIGFSVLKSFEDIKKKVLIIDYNPEVINKLIKEGYHCIYGEVTDEEILERMNLPKIEMLISTITSVNDTILLLKRARKANRSSKLIVTAADVEDAFKFYRNGADYVILPHFLGGELASNFITNIRKNKVKISDEKKKHITYLHERRKIGHNHPKDH